MLGPGVLVGTNQYQQISALPFNEHTVTRCEFVGERTILLGLWLTSAFWFFSTFGIGL